MCVCAPCGGGGGGGIALGIRSGEGVRRTGFQQPTRLTPHLSTTLPRSSSAPPPNGSQHRAEKVKDTLFRYPSVSPAGTMGRMAASRPDTCPPRRRVWYTWRPENGRRGREGSGKIMKREGIKGVGGVGTGKKLAGPRALNRLWPGKEPHASRFPRVTTPPTIHPYSHAAPPHLVLFLPQLRQAPHASSSPCVKHPPLGSPPPHTWFCFSLSCASYDIPCRLHPPHGPKCGHGGVTAEAGGDRLRSFSASAKPRRTSVTRAVSRSPGSARSHRTTKPEGGSRHTP